MRRTPRQLGRRMFLGGVGAGAMALPYLRGLTSTARAADAFPKRLVVFYYPNGSVPGYWHPTGTETNFTLSEIAAPLDVDPETRKKLVFFRGVDIGTRDLGPGGGAGHNKGMGMMLTASELLPPDANAVAANLTNGLASGISVDQRIADHIGTTTAFRSLELGVYTESPTELVTNRMIYRGGGVALAPWEDPRAAFEHVFGSATLDPEAAERRRARKLSVVDFLKEDFRGVESRLGVRDRQRLEQHKEGVLAIEKRLGLVTSCGTPPEQRPVVPGTDDAIRDAMLNQMDIAVAAMRCDLTRVVSFQWTQSLSNAWYDWLDLPVSVFPPDPNTMGHHLLSHDLSNADTSYGTSLAYIHRFYMEQLAYLLSQMNSVEEGDGTMLDNSAVLVVTEVAHGNHALEDMPFLLAGGAGGAIDTGTNGRFLTYNGEGHQRLLVALCQAFGIDTDVFGDPRVPSGPLPGLLK